jgi:pimeloyl-ACP methyl ester carboxylesterase
LWSSCRRNRTPLWKRFRLTAKPLRREVAASEGTEISYLVFDGAGPAVVILHGLAGSGREFVRTARALDGRKVVLVDQRGHGFSTRFPSDTSRAAFVADVVRVIVTESLGAVDLVGQSMGAHTAMLVAATRPDLVRRLVLLEGNEGSGTEEESAALGEYFRGWKVPFADRDEAKAALGDGPLARTWIEDLEEKSDGLYPRFDAGVMVATISNVSPRWDAWGRISAPTLVLFADHGMFTDEQKARFAQHRPGVTRVDLIKATHDAHLDAFDQWIAALVEFIT